MPHEACCHVRMIPKSYLSYLDRSGRSSWAVSSSYTTARRALRVGRVGLLDELGAAFDTTLLVSADSDQCPPCGASSGLDLASELVSASSLGPCSGDTAKTYGRPRTSCQDQLDVPRSAAAATVVNATPAS